MFVILASLEGAQGDTGVVFESCSLSSELTLELEYLVRIELWPLWGPKTSPLRDWIARAMPILGCEEEDIHGVLFVQSSVTPSVLTI